MTTLSSLPVGDAGWGAGTAIADTNSVAERGGPESIVQTALDAFGTVSVLVNNAGVISYATFEDITVDQWNRMEAVTFGGAFWMSRAVWPVFMKNSYGRIVNTTSAAGFAGSELLSHYGAAKLGVAGLTKCLALEGLKHNVRVNAIAPMAVTRMNSEMFFGGVATPGENWQKDIHDGVVPIGPPAIVSPTVAWLAHRSTEVSGDVYSTTSGRVARVGFVIGAGYFNPTHRPEDLRDNVDQIRSLADILDPTSLNDEGPVIANLFAQQFDRDSAAESHKSYS
jgi:NAD(P)-dependent dehydrogenase (short-subunit alcohol dehydrogenase family)